MSDRESIEWQAARDAAQESAHHGYVNGLLEMAEAALIEKHSGADIEDLVSIQLKKEPYRDRIHAILNLLLDANYAEADRIRIQQHKASIKGADTKKRIAKELWADRIQAAKEIKGARHLMSANETASRVIEDEIKQENITNDADLKRLRNTTKETLRKKLGAIDIFKTKK
jgi:hypothetical protein